ncbi:pentatricopeptide (PPR) repeat-containing protein [Striga asiatica]|uniref:Pentatricopeptide (PPR) repeat-containing protein n=1 Tax=Striga asiatica TaxID=4170 RepID=A0A5A7PXS0_STRAF|nr:pentatricopeptide (PPR) repeat-containing protein [Striga asiatica]
MKANHVFFSWRFLSSSPIRHELGKSLCCSQSSLLYRCLCTKGAVVSFNFREETKNISGLDDALSLYENLSRTRPLPSIVQFTRLLSHVVHLKEYSAAINLFKDICSLGVSVNEHTMNIAINSFCLLGRVDYGFSILGWFSKRGCTADKYTFNTLLTGLFREKRTNDAQELLRKMVEERLCELGIEGMVDEAEGVVEIMKQQHVIPNVACYNALMNGFCLQGRMDKARNVFDSLCSSKNCAPDVITYDTLINGYCRKMKMDDAMVIFREMPHKGIKPDVVNYTTILRGFFRAGKWRLALDIFYEMQAVGLKPNFYTYCNLLDGLCRNGQVERALSLLVVLERKGQHLHNEYYTIVMNGLIRSNELNAAQAIFGIIVLKGLEHDVLTYNVLIKGCCQKGLLEEAKDLLFKMVRAGLSPNEVTYNTIVQGNLAGGLYDDVEMFMEEMVAKGFSPNSATFQLLLSLFDSKEKNRKIFKNFQKLAPNSFKQKVDSLGTGSLQKVQAYTFLNESQFLHFDYSLRRFTRAPSGMKIRLKHKPAYSWSRLPEFLRDGSSALSRC